MRRYCLPCPKRVDVILHLEFRFVFFCLSPPIVRRPTLIPVLTRCQNNDRTRIEWHNTNFRKVYLYVYFTRGNDAGKIFPPDFIGRRIPARSLCCVDRYFGTVWKRAKLDFSHPVCSRCFRVIVADPKKHPLYTDRVTDGGERGFENRVCFWNLKM